MKTKRCRECRELKPIEQFYKHKQMADGHLNKCKNCVCSRIRAYRRNNDSVREYDRERAKTPKVKARIRENTIRWRKQNPDKYRAQTAIGNAVRDGKLKKQPCEICGSMRAHAHHDDYAKPLEVRWLCPKHHIRGHHEIQD
jgi:hypothetical protein